MMGAPKLAGWFISWNTRLYTWMMNGRYPKISGHATICSYNLIDLQMENHPLGQFTNHHIFPIYFPYFSWLQRGRNKMAAALGSGESSGPAAAGWVSGDAGYMRYLGPTSSKTTAMFKQNWCSCWSALISISVPISYIYICIIHYYTVVCYLNMNMNVYGTRHILLKEMFANPCSFPMTCAHLNSSLRNGHGENDDFDIF